LAEAILSLLQNRDQAAEMGRRGREMAMARFQWPEFITQLHALYEHVLAERKGAGRKAA
jgi:glycosyltransferase involved in cell wall biosynthesis